MEGKKLRKAARKLRRNRCATEPPLSLVCTQVAPQDSNPLAYSPAILDVSWTWDTRVLKPKTFKRRNVVVGTSFRRKQTFRGGRHTHPRIGQLASSMPSSARSSSSDESEYFDARVEIEDDDENTVSCDPSKTVTENIISGHRKIARSSGELISYNSKARAISTISNDHFKPSLRAGQTDNNSSTRNVAVASSVDDSSDICTRDSFLDDTLPERNGTVRNSQNNPFVFTDRRITQAQSMETRELKRKERLRRRPASSYIDAVAKTIKQTLRKSDQLFPRNHLSPELAVDHSKPNYHEKKERTLACETHHATSERKLSREENKFKRFWRKIAKRKTKDSNNTTVYSSLTNKISVDDFENFLLHLENSNSSHRLVNSKPGSRAHSTNNLNLLSTNSKSSSKLHPKSKRKNKWREKYKKSALSRHSSWKYCSQSSIGLVERESPSPSARSPIVPLTPIQQPPKAPCPSPGAKQTGVSPNEKFVSHKLRIDLPKICNESSKKDPNLAPKSDSKSCSGSPSYDEAKVRDKVEIFDITDLSSVPGKPIQVHHNNAVHCQDQFIGEDLMHSIQETLHRNSDKDCKLAVQESKGSSPSSPLLKRFLSTIKEGSVVSWDVQPNF